jgi:IS30 family transposase
MKSRNGDRHGQIVALLSEGLSQKEAARQLGLSPSTVSRVLADHRVDDGPWAARDYVDAIRNRATPKQAREHARVSGARFSIWRTNEAFRRARNRRAR